MAVDLTRDDLARLRHGKHVAETHGSMDSERAYWRDLAECADAPADLRAFVASALRALREDDSFELGVAAALKPDPSSQLRADNVVLPRISELIDIGEV